MVETDVWGLPYKIVAKKLNRCPPGVLPRGRELELAAQLFPRSPETTWTEIAVTGPRGLPIAVPTEKVVPFTLVELVQAGGRHLGGKIPGPDAVLNKILKIFLKEDPEIPLSLFNVCWRGVTFSKRWKRARLVLLVKRGGRSRRNLEASDRLA